MSNPSLLCVPYRFKTSTLYSQIPDSGLGDFTVTRSASNAATRVNAQGFIETVADNVPRLDYPLGGITAGCPALLVEPAATNGIRNNSMVGAVAGTPGTLPTNWSNQLGGGITRTIVGTGTENGVSYIDIRFSGTQNDTTPTDIRFESTTQIVASNGQTWSESVWLKIVAAPNPPTDYRLYMFERDSGGVFIKSATQVASLTTTLTRYSFTRALDGGATVARVQPALTFTTANGSTYDFTIRIGYPQMEQSSVATSVIPTTTAAITRGAETISKTGVSSLIGQTQGTIYCEFAYFGRPISRSGPLYLRQASLRGMAINADSIGTGITFGSRNDGGDTFITLVPGALQLGTYYKIAIGYDAGNTPAGGQQANGVVAYVNGVQVATGTLRVPDAVGLSEFRMYSANAGSDTEIPNIRIRAHSIYPTRLPNTGPLSLQSLTQ